ncbi:MAG: lamin tail domain-containing protein [Candidatus Eiseniibacteriota bacterium]
MVLALVLPVLPVRPVSADPSDRPVVLNEVFYDAVGADAGHQFVELANRTDQTVPLAGYRLEAGDGAGANRWRTIWTGGAGDVIAPFGRFTIGEPQVTPAPDRVLTFDLENGPDAVRLAGPGGLTQDVLGYGTLTYAEYFEARPAEDVPSGFSLARLPDGADSDDNAADFHAVSPPTPGAPNRPEIDLGWAHFATPLERVEAGDPVTLTGRLVNRGASGLASGEADVRLWAAHLSDESALVFDPNAPLPPDSLVAHGQRLPELEPGDSADVELAFVPPWPGAWRVSLAVSVLDDGAPGNDRGVAVVQVGPGAMLISEVCSAPEDGPEWVEVRNVSAMRIPLDRWGIEDATGRLGRVVDPGAGGTAFHLEPESLVVFTSDPAALLARHPTLALPRIVRCEPWPALNHTRSTSGPAEVLVLRAPDGRASDRVELPGGDPEGATRERRQTSWASRDPSNWGWSAARGGTPGRANTLWGAGARAGVELSIVPQRLAPTLSPSSAALVSWRTGFERARIWLRVFDLRGRPVRTLIPGEDAPGTAGIAFDGADAAGRPLPPGLYVLGLEAESMPGLAHVRARSWLEVR